MTVYQWKKAIIIPDGTHSGEIVDIIEKTEPYAYTDIIIKIDGFDFEMKYGCPSTLSENSKLGRLMMIFGEKFEEGKDVDVDKVLLHRRVSFMVLKTRNMKDGKDYSNIVDGSLQPEVSEVKPQEFGQTQPPQPPPVNPS
jgi:hypothetical protein